MENKKEINKNITENFEDLDSSRESQIYTAKGLEHITEEYRNKLMSFIQDKIKEIKKQEKDIKGDINNLAQTIQDIVDKNHKDFISTFSNFMDSVRKDLKLKLEQMEKIEEEKRKINDIRSIKCERDYFRLEAIRLSRMTNNLKKIFHYYYFQNFLFGVNLSFESFHFLILYDFQYFFLTLILIVYLQFLNLSI